MRRKIAILLVAGVVLVVMMFAMSPGFAAQKVDPKKGIATAKAGGTEAETECPKKEVFCPIN